MALPDVDRERIYVFDLDDEFLFKHYFEPNDVFDSLAAFYDADAYRFEVPERAWEGVAETLREYAYEPEVVEDVGAFVVVKAQYTEHAEILKRSVANWTRRGHHFFLMRDPLAVEVAVGQYGATPVEDTAFVAGL